MMSRRMLLGAMVTGVGAAACGRQREYVASHTATVRVPRAPAPATPASGDPAAAPPTGCIATEPNIEGPFFKAGAPRRILLADEHVEGTRLTLNGRILDTDCQPIPGAHLDLWHADHDGAYDNTGYTFRAKLRSDDLGAFAVETIVPGRYLNGDRYRPAHIHLKIGARGKRPLTTQLYFEGDPYNAGDPFIRRSLIMSLSDTPWGKAATYDIVLGSS